MRVLKKILLWGGGVVVVLVLLAVLFVGPWPVYSKTNFDQAKYYRKALSDLDAAAQETHLTPTPGKLKAGWAARDMTPPVGVPLAGYGKRNGKSSTGVHDRLFARALVLNDGQDTVAIVGADMLLIPPKVAELCAKSVAEKTHLTDNDILYHASHTHCGPGGMMEGLMAKTTFGAYRPDVPPLIAKAFADAIIEAYESMKPAKLGQDVVDATQYIRNRAREAGVDPSLNVALVEQEDGARCYMVRFSAHPTIYSDDMLEFSAEYPGALVRHIEKDTGAKAMYLGGALGSMSTTGVDAPSRDEKVDAMGSALAKLAEEKANTLTLEDTLDVASLSVSVGMPAIQVRPKSPKWRLSPFAARFAGLDGKGHIQMARIGAMMLVGVSFDFSGEVSADWQQWARSRGYTLWTTSFAPGYCGYLSPDKYYGERDEEDGMGYEIGLMNWYGPDTEAYFTELFHHAAEDLAPTLKTAARQP